MITPKELREKADKMFFRVLSAQFNGEDIFPLTMPSNKKISGNTFSDYSNDLVPLYQQSKQAKGRGYSVDWVDRTINATKQSIPTRIYFENLQDFLSFTQREKAYRNISANRQRILEEFPKLQEWTNNNTATLLKHIDQWEDILIVCNYFVSHVPPHPYFIRELPLPVHSKFIEQNIGILKLMLDMLLTSDAINVEKSDFAGRYRLKKVSAYTQIRVLDEKLKPYLGYDECTLPIDDAAWLEWLPDKVFIVENQICYLTFPLHNKSVAIFGEGFKSRLTKYIPWLGKTQIYCWFDLDAAGFEMLNIIRQNYPSAKSFLMDKDTYDTFEQFSVENTSKAKKLSYLSDEEQAMYKFLIGQSRRLEQERISQAFVLDKIKRFH